MSDSDIDVSGGTVGGPDEHEPSRPQSIDVPQQQSHSERTKDVFKLGLALSPCDRCNQSRPRCLICRDVWIYRFGLGFRLGIGCWFRFWFGFWFGKVKRPGKDDTDGFRQGLGQE